MADLKGHFYSSQTLVARIFARSRGARFCFFFKLGFEKDLKSRFKMEKGFLKKVKIPRNNSGGFVKNKSDFKHKINRVFTKKQPRGSCEMQNQTLR